MNKKFLISWVVAFVVWMIGSFAVHGAWLSDIYATMPNIMRTEEGRVKLLDFGLGKALAPDTLDSSLDTATSDDAGCSASSMRRAIQSPVFERPGVMKRRSARRCCSR